MSIVLSHVIELLIKKTGRLWKSSNTRMYLWSHSSSKAVLPFHNGQEKKVEAQSQGGKVIHMSQSGGGSCILEYGNDLTK